MKICYIANMCLLSVSIQQLGNYPTWPGARVSCHMIIILQTNMLIISITVIT